MVHDEQVLPFPGSRGAIDDVVLAGVEALLFASGEPVGVLELVEALDGVDAVLVREALDVLQRRFAASDHGIVLVEAGKGWQLRSDARFAGAVQRLRGGRPARLTRPALEVLAVIAWEQPVTRAGIDAVRGVDSGGVLKTLVDRGLVKVAGRSDEPGRPLLYRTTPVFLELYSLASLRDLPTLAERDELGRGADTTLPRLDDEPPVG